MKRSPNGARAFWFRAFREKLLLNAHKGPKENDKNFDRHFSRIFRRNFSRVNKKIINARTSNHHQRQDAAKERHRDDDPRRDVFIRIENCHREFELNFANLRRVSFLFLTFPRLGWWLRRACRRKNGISDSKLGRNPKIKIVKNQNQQNASARKREREPGVLVNKRDNNG